MKHFIIVLVATFVLTGCKQNKWTKSYLKKECIEAQLKNNASLDKKLVEVTCECMAERRIAKFKNEQESLRGDGAELLMMSTECAEEGYKAVGKAPITVTPTLDSADKKRLDSISGLQR